MTRSLLSRTASTPLARRTFLPLAYRAQHRLPRAHVIDELIELYFGDRTIPRAYLNGLVSPLAGKMARAGVACSVVLHVRDQLGAQLVAYIAGQASTAPVHN